MEDRRAEDERGPGDAGRELLGEYPTSNGDKEPCRLEMEESGEPRLTAVELGVDERGM